MREIVDQFVTHVRGTWRYRWYAMFLAWVIVIPGWLYVAQMPDEYEASAKVYVDTDSILRPLMRDLTVQTNVHQRIELMTRTLLSRPTLQKVARMTDLDLQAKTPEQMEALIDRLKSDIQLKAMRTQRNLYTIAYEHNDPELAKRVVQALLTIFVESSLGETRESSDTAQKFLDEQIKEYERRLNEAEARLMQFKREHVGTLPKQGGDYFGQMEAAQTQLEQARLQLDEAINRRNQLERQLEDMEGGDALGLYSQQSETTITTSVDGRIEALRKNLDQLLLRYTEQHPDVREIKRMLAQLEEQRQEEIEAMGPQEGASGPTESPLYQQRKLALDQAEANVAAMRARVKEYEQRVANLKDRVDTLPQVEANLKRLNRDYAITKERYDALVARRESVQMSEELEQTGENVKFRVIEPPRVPLTPSGPNRIAYSGIALLVALGAGGALAFLLSQVWPVIFDNRALRDIAQLPVFGNVSQIWTRRQLMQRRLEVGAFVAVGMMLLAAYGGVIWLQRSGGLQELYKAVRSLI